MSVPASLFIQPILQRTQGISSPKVTVLSAQEKYSIIDSILAVNLSNIPIFVTVYISTNLFVVVPSTQIQPNSILQLLKEAYFGLNAGEILLASSDSSQNLFNINIEGRLFLEVS
jgi:hypothetical protein